MGAKVTSLNEEASEKQKESDERERGWWWSPVCPLEGGGLVTSTDLRRVFSPCTKDCMKIVIKKKNHP